MLGPNDFHSMKKIHYWSQWGPETGYDHSSKYLFYVEENKEIHMGLEQFERKYMIRVGELSF